MDNASSSMLFSCLTNALPSKMMVDFTHPVVCFSSGNDRWSGGSRTGMKHLRDLRVDVDLGFRTISKALRLL